MANKEYTHAVINGESRYFKDENARKSLETLTSAVEGKEEKHFIATTTLTAGAWVNGVYTLETSWASSEFDLEVQPNGDELTDEQLAAWEKARVVGSATKNQVKALGEVPAVDIPVVIKGVAK